MQVTSGQVVQGFRNEAGKLRSRTHPCDAPVLVLQPLAAGRVYTFQVRTVVVQARAGEMARGRRPLHKSYARERGQAVL